MTGVLNIKVETQWSTTSTFDTFGTFTVNQTATAFQITAVEANTLYYVRSRAFNAVGNGPWSTTVSVTTRPAVPSRVTNLRTTIVSSHSVVLHWDVPDNGEVIITRYEAQRSTNSSFSGATTNSTGINQTNFNNLSSDTIYYFRVRAINSSGNGEYSSTFSVTTGTTVTLPSAPLGFSVVAPNAPPNQLIFGWSGNIGEGVTSYQIQYGTSISFAGWRPQLLLTATRPSANLLLLASLPTPPTMLGLEQSIPQVRGRGVAPLLPLPHLNNQSIYPRR